jgi:EEF1A N-terminal glycine/lysine methyltransferase
VQGHLWGSISDEFSTVHAGSYTRILAADCLWMPDQHRNLAATMTHFLSSTPGSCVLIVAGFHTGRANVAAFLEEIVPEEGLEVVKIMEKDVDGKERQWVRERAGEDITSRKRWCVCAVLERSAK